MKTLFYIFLISFTLEPKDILSLELNDVPVLRGAATMASDVVNIMINRGNLIKNKISSFFPQKKVIKAVTNNRKTTPDIIRDDGYNVETHTIITADGYVLEVHRIPYPRNFARRCPPRTILLHHGILGSSADWVLAGPEKGLAYILSNAYYDVWMANARGNTYSRAHVSKDINSFDFWDFSFHEMGQYDLTAVIDHIIRKKGVGIEINYVGFSMGTTVVFTLLSTQPRYNNVLNAVFAIAPIVYTENIKSPLRLMAKYKNDMDWIQTFGENGKFFPSKGIKEILLKYANTLDRGRHKSMLSKNLFFTLCGYNNNYFNRSLLSEIMFHLPAGTSTKTLVHYAQGVHSGGLFQQFDYGRKGNKRKYLKFVSPRYRIENVKVPVALISSDNDWLSVDNDVKRLLDKLPNLIEHFILPYKGFSHVDFLFGKNATATVFDKLLQWLSRYSKDLYID